MLALSLQQIGNVVDCGKGVVMVGSSLGCMSNQYTTKHELSLIMPPLCPHQTSQVVGGGEGVWMVRSELGFTASQRTTIHRLSLIILALHFQQHGDPINQRQIILILA
jgi:hypothetical protein